MGSVLRVLAAALAVLFLFGCAPDDNPVADMLLPVAYLSVDEDSAGSAVAISRDSENVYLVTAYHVVERSILLDVELTATFPKLALKELPVTVERSSKKNDVSLISIPLSRSIYVPLAVFCDFSPAVGDEVWAVGAGMGSVPFPTRGNVGIASVEFEYNFGQYTAMGLQHSAPIVYGNSGGPLYVLGRYGACVAGINLAVQTTNDFMPLPVYHMGFAISSRDVRVHLGI